MSSYGEMIESLKKSMVDDHIAVNRSRNPVYGKLGNIGKGRLSYVITQYTIFPRNIVSYLENVREEMKEFDDVYDELERNIKEEKGSATKDIKHYDILTQGIKDEFGLDITIICPTPTTATFDMGMYEATFMSDDKYAIMGATYAMEATAVPELEIVKELTNELSRLFYKRGIFSETLKGFFDIHINDLEIGHENGLRDACEKYVNDEKTQESFVNGFNLVMNTMDKWWAGLNRESEMFGKNFKNIYKKMRQKRSKNAIFCEFS